MREASAAAIATSSSQESSRCTPVSSLGTNVEALTKINELAQKPVCSQTRSRYCQLSGARRTRPMAPAVSPALTTATTPETSNSCFGQQVDDIGKRHRKRHLGQARAAEEGQDRTEKAPASGTEDDPAEEGLGEMRDAGRKVGVRALCKHADEDGKEHDRRGVVEQALAFEQPGEPSRRSDLAEDRHDGSRIGRCNDCADQQCHGKGDSGREGQAEADRRGGGKDGDDREGQDRRPIRRDLAQVERQGSMKHQQRQKNDEEDRRVERKVDDRPDDVVEGVCQRRVEQERREAADRDTDDGEEHGVRQMEPLRGRLDEAGEDQKPGHD